MLGSSTLGAVSLSDWANAFVNAVWSTPLFFMLLGIGLAFSVGTKFAQWRILAHGLDCLRGKYDNPNDPGALTHFQALCAALSATIGLGNIAGVAVAVALGGPGAVFWMWVVGLFGMALKFAECSLAVMYRDVRDVPDPGAPALMESDAESRTLEYRGELPPDPGARERARGEVRGGPMWYIQKALVDPLRRRGNILWVLFKLLAVLFAVSTMLNSFGGGNMFQGWNVSETLETNFNVPRYLAAATVSILVALVIIGGIRRIGHVAATLVPFMCAVYVLGALYIILKNAALVPECFVLIFSSAFNPTNAQGSFVGVSFWVAFTWGLRRACFSNEAGEGSAAMAHSAAKTREPIREGVVAGLEPFIDTLVICTMSALVLLITGVWNRPAVGEIAALDSGRVIVVVDHDCEPRYLHAYDREIVPGESVAIHLDRTFSKQPEVLTLRIASVERDGDGWSNVKTVTLTTELSTIDEVQRPRFQDRLARIQIGMPVHRALDGAEMMRFAFDTSAVGMGKWIITIGVCLFAFSTMISWSYYGEKGAEYLFGPGAILPYKFVFVVFVFLGMVLPEFSTVYDFSDGTTGLMVLCNLPAILILMPTVLRAAKDYFRRLDAGEFTKTR